MCLALELSIGGGENVVDRLDGDIAAFWLIIPQSIISHFADVVFIQDNTLFLEYDTNVLKTGLRSAYVLQRDGH